MKIKIIRNLNDLKMIFFIHHGVTRHHLANYKKSILTNNIPNWRTLYLIKPIFDENYYNNFKIALIISFVKNNYFSKIFVKI
jgi:ABC-type amino acid transport system permease subunit